MAESYAALVSQAQEWFERADSAGWFDQSDRRRFAAVERATPADLFAGDQMRPLVIALFGGTGVGKSSLLNRLAGTPVARVGVERPTSRDVTLYVHESVRLADLPAELPLDRVDTRTHAADGFREVLWIDAPDIDSTEETNRRCALAWLPHVDLVCYVVSPERYRDDIGWKVLHRRGQKHGWMFVMNRWDEGDRQQREDFLGMLRGAGFDPPLLLCTCCREEELPLPSPDEFDQVQTTIRELLDAHAVRELSRLGHRARLQDLRGVLDKLQACFGGESDWERVGAVLRERFRRARQQLMQGAAWTMQHAAARFAVRDGGVVGRMVRQVVAARVDQKPERLTGPAGPDAGELVMLTAPLWDDWAQSKIDGCLDAVEVAAGRSGVRVGPVRRRLDAVADRGREVVIEAVQDHVRAALVRPGSVLVRVVRRVTGFLTAALPAAALAWVGFAVFRGYYQATTGGGTFLGTPFAVHSALLVLVAWALPFLLDRMLRPSVERAVLRAMRVGFGSGLDALEADFEQGFAAAADEARQYLAGGQTVLKAAAALMVKPVDGRNPALARLICATAADGADTKRAG